MAGTHKSTFPSARRIHRAGKTGTTVLKFLAFFVLLTTALLHLKASFLMQLAVNGSNSQYSYITAQKNPVVLTKLAGREHLVNGNIEKAQQLYNRALEQFILYVPAWLGLAELFNDLGDKERAAAALLLVEKTSDRNNMAWRRAMLAYELDQEKVLAANLVWLAENQVSTRKEVFTLANLIWDNPIDMMQLFQPDLFPDILRYHIKSNEPQKAKVTWMELDKAGLSNKKNSLNYVNYLLRQDDIESAKQVWASSFHNNGLFLYNGSLNEPFTGSGFGWRISKAPGFVWTNLENKHGLKVTFEGKENVSFRLSQVVPLEPGNYVLSGVMGAESLKTDQRPFWSIRGFKCNKLSFAGGMVPSTLESSKFTLPFTVPKSCQAVQVTLQRKKSYYFDNKISGTLMINNLKISKLE